VFIGELTYEEVMILGDTELSRHFMSMDEKSTKGAFAINTRIMSGVYRTTEAETAEHVKAEYRETVREPFEEGYHYKSDTSLEVF